MTTSLVRLFAVISGAQMQRALEWRTQRLPCTRLDYVRALGASHDRCVNSIGSVAFVQL